MRRHFVPAFGGDEPCGECENCVDHSPWVRLEPGDTIPPNQPYLAERKNEVAVTVPRYAGEYFIDSSWKPTLKWPTESCVIRAYVDSWPHPRILFGHPNPGEEGMTFCRAIDGLSYRRDEIRSFEILWIDDPETPA